MWMSPLLSLLVTAAPAASIPCLAMKPEPCLSACEKGDEKSCTTLGVLAEDGLLPPAYHARLFAQVHTTCATYGGRRCFAEGVMRLAGIGTAKDAAGATKLFSSACEAGHQVACGNLAVRYYRGEGIEQDHRLARRLALEACDTAPAACLNASWFIATGIGGPADPKAAIALLEKTCVQFLPACGRLANDLLSDVWIKPDVERALTIGKQGCARGDGKSCETVGKVYLGAVPAKQDDHAALPFFEKACQLGELMACFNLGVMYDEGRGVKPNLKKSAEYAMLACDLGNQLGCNNLAALMMKGKGTKKDPAGARDLLRRSCDTGAVRSCFSYGLTLARGIGGPLEKKKAIEVYKHACGAGLDIACTAERLLDR